MRPRFVRFTLIELSTDCMTNAITSLGPLPPTAGTGRSGPGGAAIFAERARGRGCSGSPPSTLMLASSPLALLAAGVPATLHVRCVVRNHHEVSPLPG